jgi:hypothetical protein
VNEVEEERERCRQRRRELGDHEYQRLLTLRDEAQRLCYSLCVLHKRTPRVEHLLLMAEDRRERRSQHLWPWVSYYDRTGQLIVTG